VKEGPFNIRSVLLITVFVWAVIFMPHLGTSELRHKEALHALTAVHMIESGNWVVPFLWNRPVLNAFPLHDWLMAVCMYPLGQSSELAARLPSALVVLAFVLMLILIPHRGFDPEHRFIMAILYLTTVCIMEKGRLAGPEVIAASTTGMAIYGWLRGVMGDYSPWSTWIGASLCLALSVLCAGLIGAFVFYVTVLCVCFRQRRLRRLLHPAHLISIVIWVGPFVLWSVAVTRRVTGVCLWPVWQAQLMNVIGPASFVLSARLEVIGRMVIYLLPGILVMPLLWMRTVVEKIPSEKQGLFKGLRVSIVICSIVFMILPGSVAWYVMPLTPLCWFVLAWLIPLQDKDPKVVQARIRIMRFLLLVMLLVSAGIVLFVSVDRYTVGLLICTLVVVVYLLQWHGSIYSPRVRVLFCALPLALGMGHYSAVDAVLDKPSEDTRTHARIIDALVPEHQTITVWQRTDPVLAFYIRAPLSYINDISCMEPDRRYLLMDASWAGQGDVEDAFALRRLYDVTLPGDKGHYVLWQRPERINQSSAIRPRAQSRR
jgi:4-amino-4-deoxy-L-arabinose transferase-like glycosyltransferase